MTTHFNEELNGLANDTDLPIITGAQFNKNTNYLYDVSELAIREANDITHVAATTQERKQHIIQEKKAQQSK